MIIVPRIVSIRIAVSVITRFLSYVGFSLHELFPGLFKCFPWKWGNYFDCRLLVWFVIGSFVHLIFFNYRFKLYNWRIVVLYKFPIAIF